MAKPVYRVRAPSVRLVRDGDRPAHTAATAPVQRDFSLSWPSPMMSSLFGGVGSSTGIPVTPLSALQSATVYGCVKALAEDMAKLPLRVETIGDDGFWFPDTNHSINNILLRPNRWMTLFELIRYIVASLALRGNAIVVIKRGWDGSPEELIPVNWDRVSLLLSPRGWLFYLLSHPALGEGLIFEQDDIIHLRGMTFDGGYVGVSPIAVAQDVFGLSIATQQHGAVLFRQGAQIGGLLKHPGKLTPEARTNLINSWRDRWSGVQNAHMTAVLEEGMAWEKIGMTNEDAQFLQTRAFQVIEICRMFRVPPHKVFDLTRATFSNIEAQEQGYINDVLLPLAMNMEQTLRARLFHSDEMPHRRVVFEFDGLLRGDKKSRYDAAGVGIDKGFLSQNDVRRSEGMPPIANGDEYRVQINTAPLGSPAATGEADPTKQGAGIGHNGGPRLDDGGERPDDPLSPAENVTGEQASSW